MKKVLILSTMLPVMLASCISCDKQKSPELTNTVTIDNSTRNIVRGACRQTDGTLTVWLSPSESGGREIYHTSEWVCVGLPASLLGQWIDLEADRDEIASKVTVEAVDGFVHDRFDPGRRCEGSLIVKRNGDRFEVELTGIVLGGGTKVACRFGGAITTQYQSDNTAFDLPGVSTVGVDGAPLASDLRCSYEYYGSYFSDGLYITTFDFHSDNSTQIFFWVCHSTPGVAPGVYTYSATPADRTFTQGSAMVPGRMFPLGGGTFTLAVAAGGGFTATFDMTGSDSSNGSHTVTGSFVYAP